MRESSGRYKAFKSESRLTIVKVSLWSHGHMTSRDAGVRLIKKLRGHMMNSLIAHEKTDV